MKQKKPLIAIALSTPPLSIQEFLDFFAGKNEEQDLADAYAVVHSQCFPSYVMSCDYEEGTPEYERARAISDAWYALESEYEQRIFAILTKEGVRIPKKGYISVLIPFMKRQGYSNYNGWWIRD